MTIPTDVPRAAPLAASGPRAVRAVAVGLVVATCAVVAHVLAGGSVGAGPVVAVAGVSAATAGCLAGSRIATPQLLGLLLLGQVGLHVLAPSTAHDGVVMAAAHLGATVLSLVLVRDGEDAWRRLADVVLPRLLLPLRVPDATGPRVRPVASAPTSGRVAGVPQGRAPPVAA